MTELPLNDEPAADDVFLDDDDRAIQRYLDGTLARPEVLRVESRIAADPVFAARVSAYDAMFATLDRRALAHAAVLWGADAMPQGIVEAALHRWSPRAPAGAEPWVPGLEQVFGSFRPAVAAFAAADAVLLAVLVGMALVRGPLQILESTVLAAKDVALFVATRVPPTEALAWLVPAVAVVAAAGLAGVWSGMKGVAARGRTS